MLYKKKLNVITKTIQFGIKILLFGKYFFEKTEITLNEQLDLLMICLNNAFNTNKLPLTPDPESFDNYLFNWRL